MEVQLSYCMTMKLPFMLVLMMMLIIGFVSSDIAEDRKECTTQLVGLSTCLPYVGGTAKAPTPDCCEGLEQVLSKSKKCLCILIRYRNDPSLGFKFNATLALNLPTICKSSVSIADCPALLHLAPNSTEAQIFNQFDKSLHAKSPPPSANSNGKEPTANLKNDGGVKARMSEFLLLSLASLIIMCI